MTCFQDTHADSVVSTLHRQQFLSLLTLLEETWMLDLLRGAIFVDFCMVFDTIDHNILLDKLQLFGICGSEHLDGFRVISLTVSNLFLWEVFCPVLNKLFLKFHKVLYWVCCYFHCMSLTYQTVCKLLMC